MQFPSQPDLSVEVTDICMRLLCHPEEVSPMILLSTINAIRCHPLWVIISNRGVERRGQMITLPIMRPQNNVNSI